MRIGSREEDKWISGGHEETLGDDTFNVIDGGVVLKGVYICQKL